MGLRCDERRRYGRLGGNLKGHGRRFVDTLYTVDQIQIYVIPLA